MIHELFTSSVVEGIYRLKTLTLNKRRHSNVITYTILKQHLKITCQKQRYEWQWTSKWAGFYQLENTVKHLCRAHFIVIISILRIHASDPKLIQGFICSIIQHLYNVWIAYSMVWYQGPQYSAIKVFDWVYLVSGQQHFFLSQFILFVT